VQGGEVGPGRARRHGLRAQNFLRRPTALSLHGAGPQPALRGGPHARGLDAGEARAQGARRA